MSARRREPAVPDVVFDGRFWWYTEWFDPCEDRCSSCQALIPEDVVPLILFKDVGCSTWQARFCLTCIPVVVARLRARS
jgi:hypothetical protein